MTSLLPSQEHSEKFTLTVIFICSLLVIGRPSDDPRNNDSFGLHGLSKLFISSIWLPEPPVSIVRKQIRC
jgi:hypothetical protein